MITFTVQELKQLYLEIAEAGAHAALAKAGIIKDKISQREAYAEFGKAKVNRWIKEGYIKNMTAGEFPNSPKRFSRLELQTLDNITFRGLNDSLENKVAKNQSNL